MGSLQYGLLQKLTKGHTHRGNIYQNKHQPPTLSKPTLLILLKISLDQLRNLSVECSKSQLPFLPLITLMVWVDVHFKQKLDTGQVDECWIHNGPLLYSLFYQSCILVGSMMDPWWNHVPSLYNQDSCLKHVEFIYSTLKVLLIWRYRTVRLPPIRRNFIVRVSTFQYCFIYYVLIQSIRFLWFLVSIA